MIIDGREVAATEGEMLHDAAKRGDVEIPVFCYEPKLGDPVGACRMCLVEIEGIPKLQTSCSTPVRDGMVVHTRTEQVKHAQSAVVEFLLVNHPLDCPVCDKGGECPLQDISMGWGPGKSRMTDQKRHFEKPVELSPLVAIDRERCILCYRCVRFSQEVSEDSQLQLLERGDRTFVGTFDDRPYVDPFHGNITDLCPVGALTSYTYRFRARPWDIEQAGSVCTLCPSQCNVSFTVRDEQVKRVIARDNPDVDDGWLCDRGRYGFEMFAAEERVTGPRLRGGADATGTRRSPRPPRGLKAGGAARPRRSSATPPTRRATWSSASCARRSARRTSSRGSRAAPAARPSCASPSPSSRPGSATSTTPTRSSSSAPTPCTARRSSTCASARRCAATAPSWRSPPTARPPLDGGADAVTRYAPGGADPLPLRAGRPVCASARSTGTRLAASPTSCATPSASSSSGASGSAARARARRPPCSTWPPRSTSPARRAPACSRSPTWPTPAACARPAASPTPAPA